MNKQFHPLPEELERLAREAVDSAFHVHRELGPGLLESVYEVSMAYELRSRGLQVRRQVYLPVFYKGTRIEAGLRLDLLIEESLILELKVVDHILPLFVAQMLTYLKLTKRRLGLIINFNEPMIRDGIRRIVL